jgi:neurofibromin 1
LSAPNRDLALDKLAAQLRLVVGYLTSSNWPLVMTRIRSRLSYLCTTIDEAPDLTDLYLVQWAHLDRTRLGQLIQEFSSSFLHVKRHAQGPVAGALRQTIWNWIDLFPEQYIALIESNRKIEGGPDVLFDGLYSASDISSSSAVQRTRAFYPLMAMLLVLCPDIARRIAMGESSRSTTTAKKASYFESLRKGLGTNRGFEACASSYVDVLGAAGRLGAQAEGCGLKAMVPEFESDLRVSAARAR